MTRLSVVIETARLRIRPLRDDDLRQLVELVGNWEVTRWVSNIPHPYSDADGRAWIAHVRQDHATGRPRRLAIALKKTDCLIGGVGLDGDTGDGSAEPSLGYWLGQPFLGQWLRPRSGHRNHRLWVPDTRNRVNPRIHRSEQCGIAKGPLALRLRKRRRNRTAQADTPWCLPGTPFPLFTAEPMRKSGRGGWCAFKCQPDKHGLMVWCWSQGQTESCPRTTFIRFPARPVL